MASFADKFLQDLEGLSDEEVENKDMKEEDKNGSENDEELDENEEGDFAEYEERE